LIHFYKRMALVDGHRNFRSHYYEKVGFRGVEEKKSLDLLLGEKPVDLARVQNFCLRFPLPSIYRIQVWKLCLGVLPRYTSSTEYVWQQREEQYNESERALILTRKLSPSSCPEIRATLVWLLETRRMRFDLAEQLQEAWVQNFTCLIASLASLVEDQAALYWIGRGLHTQLSLHLRDPWPLVDCLTQLLGEDPVVLEHISSLHILPSLPFSNLWGQGLSQLFHPTLLPRLWDKVIGGSVKVLVYVLAAAFNRCRLDLLAAETVDQVMQVLQGMKEERQEAALTSGLDLWELDGCPLVPGELHG